MIPCLYCPSVFKLICWDVIFNRPYSLIWQKGSIFTANSLQQAWKAKSYPLALWPSKSVTSPGARVDRSGPWCRQPARRSRMPSSRRTPGPSGTRGRPPLYIKVQLISVLEVSGWSGNVIVAVNCLPRHSLEKFVSSLQTVSLGTELGKVVITVNCPPRHRIHRGRHCCKLSP